MQALTPGPFLEVRISIEKMARCSEATAAYRRGEAEWLAFLDWAAEESAAQAFYEKWSDELWNNEFYSNWAEEETAKFDAAQSLDNFHCKIDVLKPGL